jgi:hypothetical protein
MAKPVHTQTDALPDKLPQTTPPQEYILSDKTGFILQSVLEMQKNIGQLTQAVTTLTDESKKNNIKLDGISHKIYAAEVAGGLLVLIGGGVFYLFWKIWDTVAPLIQIKLPH